MTDWSKKLPEEIWDHVLEYLVQYPGKLIPIESRASLSVESFQSALPQPREDLDALGNFRCVCKKFTELGINRQFTRISTRFSVDSFTRLNDIAERPHLAAAVKKFSYMVPLFHLHEESLFKELLRKIRAEAEDLRRQRDERERYPVSRTARLRPSNDQLRSMIHRSEDDENTVRLVMDRASAHKQILRDELDGRILLYSFKAFVQLQQIRLMRVQDQLDAKWASFLSRRQDLPQEFTLSAEWTTAWEHTSRTLRQAFLDSLCPATRLSSRFMDPRTPFTFTSHLSAGSLKIASWLKSLELHFDGITNLDDKILQLSLPLHAVLAAAVGLEGLHIGFGSLVTVPLDSIFHNIEWSDLRYVGFHSWMLSSKELMDLFWRHRRTLQSVRLRRVRLSEEGSWESVLKKVRLELKKLKWISLREISYQASGIIMPFQMMNAQMPNIATLNHSEDSSDSDDESAWIWDGLDDPGENSPRSEDGTYSISTHHQSTAGSDAGFHGGDGDESASHSEDAAGEEESDRKVLSVGDGEMVQHSTPTVCSPSASRCECANGYAWEDLKASNTREIKRHQWKRWELWAIKRCQLHDILASLLDN